ncbi:MAG: YkgJ family cysteine cluster protein, partial [Alphaproteobacteria bacterium]|nr:YkgJ family cysteine cluster protein [Alphaproteobacteria bacterium]
MSLTVDTPNGPFTLARECGGCTLCCKVMRVDEPLHKPLNVWCGHCVLGKGCGIHESRPPVCRNFHCVWLMDASLGPEWHPERSHMVLWLDLDGRRLNVNVDESHPDAWRGEPYYSQLKRLASMALYRDGQVVVFVGASTFVILPNRHVPLGDLAADEYIFIERLADGGWDARKVDET